MKLKLLFFLLSFSISISNAFGYEYQALVVKVIDGDTIVVNYNNDRRKIRLLYIDAPEIDQAYGKDSKVFLKNMLSNQTITVNTVKKDRYNRELSEIYLYFDGNPVFVNAKMIKSGNAWVYKMNRKNEYLINLENFARTHKSGLWLNNVAIEPWVFRKTRK
ncbi:MAG: thermonuclease family protein [Pelagibacterales bacterium]|nr:thermonuclease family protein [Pelagibacterales bacterium]